MKAPFLPLFGRPSFCEMNLALLIVIIPAPAISSEISQGIWRRPGNDAVNSLYMFLRLNGYEENYETFVSETQSLREDPTMMSLRDTAHGLGYPTTAVKLSMEHLLEPAFPKPVLLFCEHFGSGVNKWHLLLGANEKYVALLTGDRVFIHLVAVDKFRSDWSGYALTVNIQPSPLRTALRYLSFTSASLAGLSLLVRTEGLRSRYRSYISSDQRAG